MPTWVFHSEVDDERPDPLRAKFGASMADSDLIVDELRAAQGSAGQKNIKYTKYTKEQIPPNYIRGHAAFELAFHEEALWPWLAEQHAKKPSPSKPKVKTEL